MADPVLTPEQVAEYKEAFNTLFDKDGVGTITAKQLEISLKMMGQTPSEGELREVINEVNVSGNGSIDFSEFLGMMSMDSSNQDAAFQLAFKSFDKDGTGVISVANLHKVMQTLGMGLSEKECEEMIREVGADEPGKMKYGDFVRLMKSA
jgi:calmodulin